MNEVQHVGSGYRADFDLPKGTTVKQQFRLRRNGAAFDLTGMTVTLSAIHAQMWLGADYDAPYGDMSDTTEEVTLTKKIDGASCTLDGAATGLVGWVPTTTQTDTPGPYYYQFKVVDGSDVYFFPSDVRDAKTILTVTPSLFA